MDYFQSAFHSDATRTVFFYIGLVTTFTLTLRVATYLFHYLRPSVLNRYKHPNSTTWALVTGASDGIGLAFAHELCARGFNVILHGRNVTKLQGVQKTLEKDFPTCKTRLYVANTITSTSCDDFVQTLEPDLHLTILINNVGGGAALPTEFTLMQDFSPNMVTDMINLNAGFAVRLTYALMPVLFRQRKALILNISSLVRMGMPYLSVYSGTKGFLFSWSESIAVELQAEGRTNLDVCCSEVGSVQSAGNTTKGTWSNPSSRTFAKAALDRGGKGDVSQYSYWAHAFQVGSVKLLPNSIRRKILIDAVKDAKDQIEGNRRGGKQA